MIANPLPAALIIYVLCSASGVAVERRFVINGLLKRIVLIYAIGAAQLTLGIELLSLWRALTGWNLVFIHVALTAISLFVFRGDCPPGRISWGELVDRAWLDVSSARRDIATSASIFVASILFALAIVVAWMVVPFNDSYHFEMPRFWLQHQTIFPFPVHNPRITTISFLSEAITLPAFIAFRTDYGLVIATLIAGGLAAATTYSLARRIGVSVFASLAATATSVGYATFASSAFTAAAEMFLTGAFFGASLVFLMDAWASESRGGDVIVDLSCSAFLFVMACGAKNPTTLVAPFYLVFLAIAVRKAASQTGSPRVTFKRAAFAIVTSGMIALLCSGVAWNYVSNKLYFAGKGMPALMQSTISHDYTPRGVWTRMSRGAVTVLTDTLWLPKSARPLYGQVNEKMLILLGGKKSVSEDDFYFSFKPGPMKAFGPFGALLMIPAFIVGCVASIRTLRSSTRPIPRRGLNVVTLTTFTIAAFAMCHLILRWQSIGMVRLMFPIATAAAPLTALLLEKRLLRIAALALLIAVFGIFALFWAGNVSRHTGRTDGMLFKALAKLQNEHGMIMRYQWNGQPVREAVRREDYRFREVFDLVLEGLRQPCTVGFIGNENSECLYLFGRHAQNRIVPLVDASAPDTIMDIPTADFDYLVAADKFDEARAWAKVHGFEEIFTCSGPKGELAVAFRNTARNQPPR